MNQFKLLVEIPKYSCQGHRQEKQQHCESVTKAMLKMLQVLTETRSHLLAYICFGVKYEATSLVTKMNISTVLHSNPSLHGVPVSSKCEYAGLLMTVGVLTVFMCECVCMCASSTL